MGCPSDQTCPLAVQYCCRKQSTLACKNPRTPWGPGGHQAPWVEPPYSCVSHPYLSIFPTSRHRSTSLEQQSQALAAWWKEHESSPGSVCSLPYQWRWFSICVLEMEQKTVKARWWMRTFSRHSIAHHFLVDEMRYMVKKINYKELFKYKTILIMLLVFYSI